MNFGAKNNWIIGVGLSILNFINSCLPRKYQVGDNSGLNITRNLEQQ